MEKEGEVPWLTAQAFRAEVAAAERVRAAGRSRAAHSFPRFPFLCMIRVWLEALVMLPRRRPRMMMAAGARR